MSIKPETLAWLRQTAKFEGGVTAQAILHLLERVEALEAKDQLDAEAWASMRRASCDYQRRLSNLEAVMNLRQQDEDAELAAPTPEAAPVATDEDLWSLWANRRQHGAAQPPAAEPAQVAALSDALIRAECALSDIAEGEETNAAPNTLEWAKQRCAETLATIRPVMQQHKIRTSEWPPVSQHTPGANGSETAQVASEADDKVLVNCPETCWVQIRRIVDGKVIYDNHRRGTLVIPVGEPPAAQPAPAGGLVERVVKVIADRDGTELWHEDVRAAIREVAAWLDQYGCHGCSLWLREEVDR
jgi:hypothetical protein